MTESKQKPEIRILHQMARSGGTIICKCIGSMQDVVLLSEIHPSGTKLFNPLKQAHEWFQLLEPADLTRLRQGPLKFKDAIALVYERCLERNKALIIRDWSHLDFTAVPFLPRPSYRLTIAAVLKERFAIRNTATVRHPIDQWLSLRKLALLNGKITLEVFLKGYRHFAEYCVRMGFIRYEDFVRFPEQQLQILCDRLGVAYDPAFEERWPGYRTITGEVQSKRAGSTIAPVPRQQMEAGLLDAFEHNKDYLKTIKLLGYNHP